MANIYALQSNQQLSEMIGIKQLLSLISSEWIILNKVIVCSADYSLLTGKFSMTS